MIATIRLDIRENNLLLILSNDTIMKPPYDITPKILRLIRSISEKIGEADESFTNIQIIESSTLL